MYKKRKRPVVDLDALTQTLTQDITRKVYANIIEQLAAKGIDISIVAEASPGAAGKRSCASKEVDQQVVSAMT